MLLVTLPSQVLRASLKAKLLYLNGGAKEKLYSKEDRTESYLYFNKIILSHTERAIYFLRKLL